MILRGQSIWSFIPIKNNVRVMPENDDIVNDQTVIPSDEQIERVLNNPENTGIYRFTDGQRNAVLYWMEQHPDYMRNYYDNQAYNLDEVTEDIIPYVELEDSSSDESDDDLEVTSDSSDEESYIHEN